MNNTETDKSANATNHVKANSIASVPASAMTGANANSGASVDANPGASMATTDADYPNRFPSFDVTKDGPLLTEPKTLEIQTSVGRLHLVLDPTIAPIHATQMYNLMTRGAFNGTFISRFEPNFVLQFALAETKSKEGPQYGNETVLPLIRRLPLEVGPQLTGAVSHKKWNLTMARYDRNDSATTSFSILLDDAHHLDKQYTVFGHVIPDAVSVATIGNIIQLWNTRKPYIIGVREMGPHDNKVIGQSVAEPKP